MYIKSTKRKYYLKNKELIKAKLQQYKREMREAAESLGHCLQCYCAKENPKYKLCNDCRAKAKKYYQKKKNANAKKSI